MLEVKVFKGCFALVTDYDVVNVAVQTRCAKCTCTHPRAVQVIGLQNLLVIDLTCKRDRPPCKASNRCQA